MSRRRTALPLAPSQESQPWPDDTGPPPPRTSSDLVLNRGLTDVVDIPLSQNSFMGGGNASALLDSEVADRGMQRTISNASATGGGGVGAGMTLTTPSGSLLLLPQDMHRSASQWGTTPGAFVTAPAHQFASGSGSFTAAPGNLTSASTVRSPAGGSTNIPSAHAQIEAALAAAATGASSAGAASSAGSLTTASQPRPDSGKSSGADDGTDNGSQFNQPPQLAYGT